MQGESMAGAARGSRPAGENRQRYSAGAAHSHVDAAWRKLRKSLRRMRGRQLRFVVDVRPTGEALFDPVFGPHVLEMMLECGASALRGGDRECHGCQRCWTPERAIKAVCMVEFIDLGGSGGLVGLCPDCCAHPQPVTLVAEGFRRDFGLEAYELRLLPRGGRA
jgi:hypothetical protein